jgi:hypothetical protein
MVLGEKMKNEPDPKKGRRTLRERFNAAFKGVGWKDIRGIGRQTLKDLRKPGEIFALVAGAVIPGGFIAYGAYRVVKYRQSQKPANDNAEQKNPKPPENKPPGM